MKLAIASLGNPTEIETWSGIPANICYGLMALGHEVVPIHLCLPKEPWYYNWLRRYYFRSQKKWFLSTVEESVLKEIGRALDEGVNKSQPDVVLVIHGDWLAYTTFQQPACIIHDTTFATLVDYYPAFTNLATRSVKLGNLMYRRALDRADAAVFSAKWASESAVREYQASPSKIFTIPFGANLMDLPDKEMVGKWIEERSQSDDCNFLFLGIDWQRKGGPDALRFVMELNRLGIKSQLTIVGCSPNIPTECKGYVNEVGFLKKSVPTEAKVLSKILEQSHALLLPSLAECFGCVYCEANAFGLPALGRNTGGVSEIIKEGKNGLLLKSGESPEHFATRWANIWKDLSNYKALAQSSRSEYDERLNYKRFLRELEGVITKIGYGEVDKTVKQDL